MPKQIILTVDLDSGKSELKAEGFEGPACEAATKKYLEALADGASDGSGKTPEFHRTASSHTYQKVGG